MEAGMVNGGTGDGGRGRRSRVVIPATGEVQAQQEQEQEQLQLRPRPRGISDVSLGSGLSEHRRTGEACESSSSAAASDHVLSVVNNPSAVASAPVGDVARVVNEEQQRPTVELIMENVWMPYCGGREFIEFAAELPDLSHEIFEA